jgi:hypothetical protein
MSTVALTTAVRGTSGSTRMKLASVLDDDLQVVFPCDLLQQT